MITNTVKEDHKNRLQWENHRSLYMLYIQNFWSRYWTSSTCSTFGRLELLSLVSKSASIPIYQLRGFSRGPFIPLYTDTDETVTQSFLSRANRSRFPHSVPKKRRRYAWKGTSIRRVNAINESARITCSLSRSASSLLSSPVLFLVSAMSVLPRPTVFSALVKPSVAINWPLALTRATISEMSRGSNVFVLRTATGDSTRAE